MLRRATFRIAAMRSGPDVLRRVHASAARDVPARGCCGVERLVHPGFETGAGSTAGGSAPT